MNNIQTAGEGPYAENPFHFEDEPVSHLSPRHQDSYFAQFAPNKTGPARRKKRSAFGLGTSSINGKNIHKVRTCSIYMQADHKLYEHVFNKEGNRDPVRTREEIVALFYNHIKAVNQIYEVTNFGGITGLNFVIQRTTVSSCISRWVFFAWFWEIGVSIHDYFPMNTECKRDNKNSIPSTSKTTIVKDSCRTKNI